MTLVSTRVIKWKAPCIIRMLCKCSQCCFNLDLINLLFIFFLIYLWHSKTFSLRRILFEICNRCNIYHRIYKVKSSLESTFWNAALDRIDICLISKKILAHKKLYRYRQQLSLSRAHSADRNDHDDAKISYIVNIKFHRRQVHAVTDSKANDLQVF